MGVRYYDDALVYKLKKWIDPNSKIHVLKPDETKRFFETIADEKNDNKIELPLIAVSRSNDISLLSNIKQTKSFDGLQLHKTEKTTVQLNIIPILPTYQIDIYTKFYEEGDEYLREILFKLINNPKIVIGIPYNNVNIAHVANIRVLDSVSDTSDIAEHLYPGQFTRWTIQLEIQDAFLFSIPYRNNWYFGESDLEVSEKINLAGEVEPVVKLEDTETD